MENNKDILKKFLNKENFGITKDIAKKYSFELSEIYLQDAIFILKNELKLSEVKING